MLLLSQTLESLQDGCITGLFWLKVDAQEVEEVFRQALEAVYLRAQRVSEQLHREDEDLEIARRHCVHECDLARAMSITGWEDGVDSSGSGGDVRDVDDLMSQGSGSSAHSFSLPGSPRMQVEAPQATPEAQPVQVEAPQQSKCSCM